MKHFLALLMLVSMPCFASEWECVNHFGIVCNTWRMSVYKGWLVASDNTTGGEHGYAMAFVPDDSHQWKV